ncbi:carbamoyltransferase C-terminal domain-containing protein [Streptomyces nondiastaticus]|uniref:carbamoyltransferase C-terminal domain-containing protein n=1 Tax=Streptomyces nondiastaticus TaxID=3154512 RepID=UPI00343D15D9
MLGWAQGRSGYGPRALGNRSILTGPWPPGTSSATSVRREQYRLWQGRFFLLRPEYS